MQRALDVSELAIPLVEIPLDLEGVPVADVALEQPRDLDPHLRTPVPLDDLLDHAGVVKRGRKDRGFWSRRSVISGAVWARMNARGWLADD